MIPANSTLCPSWHVLAHFSQHTLLDWFVRPQVKQKNIGCTTYSVPLTAYVQHFDLCDEIPNGSPEFPDTKRNAIGLLDPKNGFMINEKCKFKNFDVYRKLW